MSNYKVESIHDLKNISSQGIDGGYLFKNNSVLENWELLLEKWIDHVQKFCSKTDGMPPYVDNEMGNVGLLMSAAWNVSGVAVCEKVVRKTKDGKKSRGRLDLWMKLPDSPMQYLIEAKHTYHLAKNKTDGSPDKYDYNQLKVNAEKESSNLEILDNQCPVAMVFLTYNVKKYKNDYVTVEEIILDILNGKIKDANRVHDDWDLVCWCFPKEMRRHEYPGVILSAKCIS